MRTVGPVDSLRALSDHDHVCWPYDDVSRFRADVVAFLSHGISRGLRVAYAGPGAPEELREHLSALPDADALLVRGGLDIIALDEVYGRGAVVDAEAAVAAYAAATERALADGYRGFRIGADVTELVRSPEQHETFVHYESLVDRYAAAHPFSAVCAYHAEIGPAALAELASVHPAAPATLSPFRIYSTVDGALGLSGEVDAGCAAQFRHALEHVRPAPGANAVVWDLTATSFLDHRALQAIDAMADRLGLAALLRRPPLLVRRLTQLVPLARVRILDEEAA